MKIEFKIDGNLMAFFAGDVSISSAGSKILATEEGLANREELYIQTARGMDELMLIPISANKVIVRTK